MRPLIVFCSLLVSCVVPIDIENPKKQSMIVFVHLDDVYGLKISVSKSLPADLNTYLWEENLTQLESPVVQVFRNDTLIRSVTTYDEYGTYTDTNFLPREDQSYSFKAFATGVDTVYSATEMLKAPVEVDSDYEISDMEFGKNVTFNATVHLAERDAYFLSRLHLISNGSRGGGFGLRAQNPFVCELLTRVDENGKSLTTFNSNCQDDQGKIYLSTQKSYGIDDLARLSSYQVQITRIGRDYYDFLADNYQPALQTVFGEPSVHTFNVRGGFGFLVVSNTTLVTVEL